jgi:hypothetical protein
MSLLQRIKDFVLGQDPSEEAIKRALDEHDPGEPSYEDREPIEFPGERMIRRYEQMVELASEITDPDARDLAEQAVKIAERHPIIAHYLATKEPEAGEEQ